jgi:hypothetical protein
MTDMLSDKWANRDFPVLVEVTRRIDQGESIVDVQTVADALGMTVEDVGLAGAALTRRRLVETRGADQAAVLFFHAVAGDAYLLTGLHPDGDDAVSQLVSALMQAAEQNPDPVEKSKLRGLADAAGGVSRSVLSGVLTAVILRAVH